MAAALAFAQYKVAKLPIRPFNLDPCDAVAHSVILVIAFVLVLSLFRALSMNGSTSSSYIPRYQQTFALSVFTMLLADLVDLARYPSVWVASPLRDQMLAWVAVYLVVAVSVQSLVHPTTVCWPYIKTMEVGNPSFLRYCTDSVCLSRIRNPAYVRDRTYSHRSGGHICGSDSTARAPSCACTRSA